MFKSKLNEAGKQIILENTNVVSKSVIVDLINERTGVIVSTKTIWRYQKELGF